MKNIFNKKFIISVLLLIVIVVYMLFTLGLEYFDKDGRFVLGGKLECPNISSATLMKDGNVFLLTGNSDNPEYKPTYNLACHNIAAVYNTKTQKVKNAGKPLAEYGFPQSILLKNGKILILGANPKLWVDFPPGSTKHLDEKIIKSQYAELFDPATRNFSFAGKMIHPRSGFSMILLPNAEVLIIGGYSYNKFVKQCEIFDPNTNKFSPAGNLNYERVGLNSVLLKDGNVFITGGTEKRVELYDFPANRSKVIGEITRSTQFFTPTILLNDGRVLIFCDDFSNDKIVPTIYSPLGNKFTELNLFDKKRKPPAYTALLPDGKVLLAGGRHRIFMGFAPISTSEIFDPKTNTFKQIRNHLKIPRSGDIEVSLKDGKVLILTGYGAKLSPIKQTEIFIPKRNSN